MMIFQNTDWKEVPAVRMAFSERCNCLCVCCKYLFICQLVRFQVMPYFMRLGTGIAVVSLGFSPRWVTWGSWWTKWHWNGVLNFIGSPASHYSTIPRYSSGIAPWATSMWQPWPGVTWWHRSSSSEFRLCPGTPLATEYECLNFITRLQNVRKKLTIICVFDERRNCLFPCVNICLYVAYWPCA